MRSPRRQHPAFSLVEMLLVIAIMAVLAGLLLASALKVREAGNRSECANHLREIGLAMHHHHDLHRVFPSNGGWDGSQTIESVTNQPIVVHSTDAFLGTTFNWGVGQPGLSPQEQTGSWAYAILPFLEQQNIYIGRDWTMPVPLYNCPSRRPSLVYAPVDDDYGEYFGGGWEWGNTDYGGNAYVVANRPSCMVLTDFSDGSSNTILVGEKALSPVIYNNRSSWYWDEPFFTGGAGGTQRGKGPVAGDGSAIVQDNPNMGYSFRYNWGAAHPGGAHFLFADGSVRMIQFGTPAATVVALMTPNGGELLVDD